jgi:DNA polymerase-3 subunit gamma/tau
MDVQEIDAASNRGIDEIRDLRDKVRYTPVEVRHKVYIIDEVHMLTPEAFNALLKTLEEPPAKVLFILATTEPHKLPATIISRCQRLDFRLIGISEIAKRLGEVASAAGREYSEQALYLIAEEAAGGLRDALSLLEQVMAYSAGEITQEDVLAVLGSVGRDVFYDLAETFARRDLAGALMLLQDVATGGKDMHHFTQQAIGYYRDLMVAGVCGDDAVKLGISPEWATRLHLQASRIGIGTIGSVLAELHALLAEIRWSSRPRLLWELAVIRVFGFAEKVAPVLQDRKPASVPVKQEAVRKPSVTESSVIEPALTEKKNAAEQAPAVKTESLQNLQRMWPRIMELVKKQSVKTHALLLSGDAVSQGNVLELRFGGAFLCEMMESAENKKNLQDVLQNVFGTVPAIRCRVATDSAKPAEEGKNPDELISSAVEIFRGKVMDDSGRQ